jgi:hypothetical protein
MVPTYRVSHLAAYARWKNEEDLGVGFLHGQIFSDESTDAQARGAAFHKALEMAVEGEHSTAQALGYTFAFTCNAEISLPRTREIRRSKDYGGIIVSGQCDGLEGRRIIDHKTVSGGFDAEYHLDGFQHKFYLDIFDADRFDWHVWEVGEIKSLTAKAVDITEYDHFDGPAKGAFEVYAHHPLTQYRYPGMSEDCRLLAVEFRDFAARMGWKGKAA